MFTICIPIYNQDVCELVKNLQEQAVKTELPFEIILMDDASEDKYRKINAAIDLSGVRYIQLAENIGRSKIRNRLGREAKYPYLIFMDGDSAIPSDEYIANYLPYFEPDIVCYGGCVYEKNKPQDQRYLRWKYGIHRESVPAKERKKEPGFSFKTGNFLVYKELLEKNPFNEAITDYGHEDTFFGIQLSERKITIQHIDNPLIHLGLEDAAIFLSKTEKAMLNLHKINRIFREKYPEGINHSNLTRAEKKLENLHCTSLVAFVFSIFKPLIKRNLLGKHPSLFLFDLYKLGTLCRFAKNSFCLFLAFVLVLT